MISPDAIYTQNLIINCIALHKVKVKNLARLGKVDINSPVSKKMSQNTSYYNIKNRFQ